MSDDDPTRRVHSDDDASRCVDPDDFPTVRGLSAGRSVFGRYVLETELGAGGMGVVWRARDTELDEQVALKFLPEVVARDEAAVDELKNETRHARRLTHPNIVRIYQFEREGAMAAISMEFVDGMTLTKLRLAQPGMEFTAETLAPLLAQLCPALDYAHNQAEIVHRDLKPANILVTRDGVVKVTDFGIARSLSNTHTRLTGRAGNMGGTLVYMSPQQLSGEDPAASDDIYALGVTLYELLTGKPPFCTGDIGLQIRKTAPKPVNQRRAALGLNTVAVRWEKTILACLRKKREDRPPSAANVARRLGLARAVGNKLERAVSAQADPVPALGMADDDPTRLADLDDFPTNNIAGKKTSAHELIVVISTGGEEIMEGVFARVITKELPSVRVVQTKSTGFAEVLALPELRVASLFVSVINNIHPNDTAGDWLEDRLDFVRQLREKTAAVIAVTSGIWRPDFRDRLRQAGANFVEPLPFKVAFLEEAARAAYRQWKAANRLASELW